MHRMPVEMGRRCNKASRRNFCHFTTRPSFSESCADEVAPVRLGELQSGSLPLPGDSLFSKRPMMDDTCPAAGSRSYLGIPIIRCREGVLARVLERKERAVRS